MNLAQLAKALEGATSFFSLSNLRPSDMGVAFADADARLRDLEARVTKLEKRPWPPTPPSSPSA